MPIATRETSAYERSYQAYLGLPSETYEFVVRSMAMDKSLRQAHDVFLRDPDLSQPSGIWRDTFEQVYENLFAMVLQPYRLLLSPLGYLEQLMRPVTLRPAPEAYSDWTRLWTDAQDSFMKATADALRGFSADGRQGPKHEGSVPVPFGDLTPVNLVRRLATEENKAFFENLAQFTRWFGESQFLLPKELFISAQAVATSYPRVIEMSEKYTSMFHLAWGKALDRFTGAIRKADPQTEYEKFFKTYMDTFADEYSKLMTSPEYIEAQNGFVNAVADVTVALRKLGDTQLGLIPFLPVATRSETDALEKRVHSYKVRADAVERRVRELEERTKSAVMPVSPPSIQGPHRGRPRLHSPLTGNGHKQAARNLGLEVR